MDNGNIDVISAFFGSDSYTKHFVRPLVLYPIYIGMGIPWVQWNILDTIDTPVYIL